MSSQHNYSDCTYELERLHALCLNAILCCTNLIYFEPFLPTTSSLARLHLKTFSSEFGFPYGTPTTVENFEQRTKTWLRWEPWKFHPLIQLDRLTHRAEFTPAVTKEITEIMHSYNVVDRWIRATYDELAAKRDATAALALPTI